MPHHSLRTITVVIGIILLIVGLIFISINFIFPNITSTEVTIATLNNFHFNGYPPETLQQSPDNIYRSIHAANIPKGQTLKVTWYSEISLGVFIFSEEQFTYFQSVLPKMQSPTSGNAVRWANEFGITYEAVGWAKRNEMVSYNVTETGNYVAVITNAMYGAVYSTVSDFNLELISYKQTASLYLYVGVFFVILGIALLTLTLVRQKTLSVL